MRYVLTISLLAASGIAHAGWTNHHPNRGYSLSMSTDRLFGLMMSERKAAEALPAATVWIEREDGRKNYSGLHQACDDARPGDVVRIGPGVIFGFQLLSTSKSGLRVEGSGPGTVIVNRDVDDVRTRDGKKERPGHVQVSWSGELTLAHLKLINPEFAGDRLWLEDVAVVGGRIPDRSSPSIVMLLGHVLGSTGDAITGGKPFDGNAPGATFLGTIRHVPWSKKEGKIDLSEYEYFAPKPGALAEYLELAFAPYLKETPDFPLLYIETPPPPPNPGARESGARTRADVTQEVLKTASDCVGSSFSEHDLDKNIKNDLGVGHSRKMEMHEEIFKHFGISMGDVGSPFDYNALSDYVYIACKVLKVTAAERVADAGAQQQRAAEVAVAEILAGSDPVRQEALERLAALLAERHTLRQTGVADAERALALARKAAAAGHPLSAVYQFEKARGGLRPILVHKADLGIRQALKSLVQKNVQLPLRIDQDAAKQAAISSKGWPTGEPISRLADMVSERLRRRFLRIRFDTGENATSEPTVRIVPKRLIFERTRTEGRIVEQRWVKETYYDATMLKRRAEAAAAAEAARSEAKRQETLDGIRAAGAHMEATAKSLQNMWQGQGSVTSQRTEYSNRVEIKTTVTQSAGYVPPPALQTAARQDASLAKLLSETEDRNRAAGADDATRVILIPNVKVAVTYALKTAVAYTVEVVEGGRVAGSVEVGPKERSWSYEVLEDLGRDPSTDDLAVMLGSWDEAQKARKELLSRRESEKMASNPIDWAGEQDPLESSVVSNVLPVLEALVKKQWAQFADSPSIAPGDKTAAVERQLLHAVQGEALEEGRESMFRQVLGDPTPEKTVLRTMRRAAFP